jgi:hypothetical protein
MSWANERTVCPVCNLANQSIEQSDGDSPRHIRHWKCAECTRDYLVEVPSDVLTNLRNAGPDEGKKQAQTQVDWNVRETNKYYKNKQKPKIYKPWSD